MKAYLYGITPSIEQTEAIVAGLEHAGFGKAPEATVGCMLVPLHVDTPHQRHAAPEIFEQRHAQDITFGLEAHATTAR